MRLAGGRRLVTLKSLMESKRPDRGQIGKTRGRSWRVAGVGTEAGSVRSGRLAWWSSVGGGPKHDAAHSGGRRNRWDGGARKMAGGSREAGQGHFCPMGVRSGRLGGGLGWWSSVDGGAKRAGGYYGGRLTERWRFNPVSLVFILVLVVDVVPLLCFSSVIFLLCVFTLLFDRLIPRRVFTTPIRPELSLGPYILPEVWPLDSWFFLIWWHGRKNLWGQIWASNGTGKRGKIPPYLMMTALLLSVQLYLYFACLVSVIIPRMVFITPTWPELVFGSPFLREYMPVDNWFFPTWYSDSLQEIISCKRIITVVGGFVPQSLAGDPVLVVYILDVFCIFNGFVCLFHGTSLFRDLYVLLIELFSAVMDFVQFNH